MGHQHVTTVLLVEDNPTVRSLVMRFLTRDGIVVVAESQSQEALEFGRRYGIALDLLIVNVQLAGQDGVTLALEFGVLCPHVRVLLMTGFGSPRLELLKLAGMRILVKPFSRRQLLDTVKDFLLLDQRADGGTTIA